LIAPRTIAGHLLEGHEAEAAERFEDYLSRATGAQTGASLA
jgi:hypothetical protein